MSRKRASADGLIQAGLRGLNKLLGHRARLGICILLARSDELSFRRLKEILEETDGNLGAQLRKLEDEGLIRARKEFQDRKPVTWYALTKQGRRDLDSHLAALGQLIRE